MAVTLSCIKTVVICDLNFPTPYEIPVIAFNKFETKSDIKGDQGIPR